MQGGPRENQLASTLFCRLFLGSRGISRSLARSCDGAGEPVASGRRHWQPLVSSKQRNVGEARELQRVPLAKRVMAFAAVSGAGLALDFCVFLLLMAVVGVSPGFANVISGAVAITFVFFVSVRRIFQFEGGFLFGRFVVYVVYHAFGLAVASAAVAYLSQHHLTPWLAKTAVLPFTFTANYLFMALLTRRGRWSFRVSRRAAAAPRPLS